MSVTAPSNPIAPPVKLQKGDPKIGVMYQAIRVRLPIPNDSEGALICWPCQHDFLGSLIEFMGKEILI